MKDGCVEGEARKGEHVRGHELPSVMSTRRSLTAPLGC